MPRRISLRPLMKCARDGCDIHFRKFRRRLFCTDYCRKEQWRVDHSDYYARLATEAAERKRKERQTQRRFEWVQEGTTGPEFVTLAEAIAQASPGTVKEIKELLPDVRRNDDNR